MYGDEMKEIKSKEIDELINKLRDEGSRLRAAGQNMIDTSEMLNSLVYYYGHGEKNEKDSTK